MPPEATEARSLDAIPSDAWTSLANRRVFFGHQSVGENVANGLTVLLADHPGLALKLVREQPLEAIEGGALIFKHVGENGDARSKMDGFVKLIEAAPARPGDIAMQKLCYADFFKATDPDSVFADYVTRIEALRQARPGLQIVHVTAPLLEDRLFPKDIIRQVLGKTTLKDRLGKVRVFNAKLRAHYGGKDPIFDLAAIEAGAQAGPDGGALLPAYATRDGGHLNPAGQRVAATEFLLFLAGLPAGTGTP